MNPELCSTILGVAILALIVVLFIAAVYACDEWARRRDETDDERIARHVEAAKRAVAEHIAEGDEHT